MTKYDCYVIIIMLIINTSCKVMMTNNDYYSYILYNQVLNKIKIVVRILSRKGHI